MTNWDKFDKNVDLDWLNQEIENSSENSYAEVPYGEYEVKIESMELKESKKGDPMLSIWFKILDGQCSNQLIFYNQVLVKPFSIHKANEFLRSLDSNVEVGKFQGYGKYAEMVDEIKDAIESQGLEYALDYGKNEKGYNTFEITDIFEK